MCLEYNSNTVKPMRPEHLSCTLNMFPPIRGWLLKGNINYSGADLGGGGLGPAPPTPHFEAQIFAAAVTPLRDVGKISPAPPLHKSRIRTCYYYYFNNEFFYKFPQVHSLKEPYGKCDDEIALEYFDTYTLSSCYINCKQKFLLETCGCRDFYMPDGEFMEGIIGIRNRSINVETLKFFTWQNSISNSV